MAGDRNVGKGLDNVPAPESVSAVLQREREHRGHDLETIQTDKEQRQ